MPAARNTRAPGTTRLIRPGDIIGHTTNTCGGIQFETATAGWVNAAATFGQGLPDAIDDTATLEAIARLQQVRDEELAALEKRREEQRKRERMPVTITLAPPTSTKSPYYRVIVTQGETIIDEYTERNIENATRVFEDIREGYESRITTRHFDSAGDTPRRDLRGDRVIRNFTPRHERVNRRDVRPEEDVVNEAGFTMDIPEQVAAQPAPETIIPPRELDELEEDFF